MDTPFPRTVALDFDPARDGFSFPNRFAWTDADLDLLSAKVRPLTAVPMALGAGLGGWWAGRGRGALAAAAAGGLLGRVGLGDGVARAIATQWPTFGLCGGMALAAVERWPAGPDDAPTWDLRPEPLRALLRRRQERTLRASLPRFAKWWLRALALRAPDGPFADALAGEIDHIETALCHGRPVVLGLVGDAPDPFSLHQVVAFGLERRGPVDATVRVYDPNAPGQTRTVTAAASARPGHTAVSTTLPTGRRASGGAHISTRPNHLAHFFVVQG